MGQGVMDKKVIKNFHLQLKFNHFKVNEKKKIHKNKVLITTQTSFPFCILAQCPVFE